MSYVSGSFRSYLVTLGVAIIVLLGSGQAADGKPAARSTLPAAQIGREFKLRPSQQVTLKHENLRIRFVAVTEDSRCPEDVNCVWAGNAAVRLEVSGSARGSKPLILNTTGNSTSANYKRYEIKLVGVSPYPRTTRKIKPRDYVITLLVTRN